MKGYFKACSTILLYPYIDQAEKDLAVSKFLDYVFTQARTIFESPGGPIFMCADYGTPFYNLVETCLQVYSENHCLSIMEQIVELFIKYLPSMLERIKCTDNLCSEENAYCMNMIIFKLFRYILLYKKIMIEDADTLNSIIQFLHVFALTTLDSEPINNIRVIANESICILVNKMQLEQECISNFI
jgi:hypothetical protein